MFTGLITNTAVVTAMKAQKLTVQPHTWVEVQKGQSISISGCCLTVVGIEKDKLSFDINPETWEMTTLSTLQVGDMMNMEAALQMGQALDGHLVSGHVDTNGKIEKLKQEEGCLRITVSFDACFQKWVVKKGSVALDGISLTINETDENKMEVCIIPHTLEVTNLREKIEGDLLNIEFDMMAKFFEKQMKPYFEKLQKD